MRLRVYMGGRIFSPMMLQAHSLFRLLSDITRLRCLLLMQAEGELCVCELTHALSLSQPKISRHLAALRDAGVVSVRRQGQWVYYRLHRELPGWARAVIDVTATGIEGGVPFTTDRAALAVVREAGVDIRLRR